MSIGPSAARGPCGCRRGRYGPALEEIRQIFGIDGAGKVYDFTPMNVWAWGEKISGCQIRIAMLDWTDSLKLEVLQPVFGEIEHKRFVDEVGGGMHHTAYYVKDYPAYRDFIVGQGGEIIFESETEDEKGYLVDAATPVGLGRR